MRAIRAQTRVRTDGNRHWRYHAVAVESDEGGDVQPVPTAPRPELGKASLIRDAHPGNAYVGFHAPRYATLLRLLSGYVRPGMTILDVGRSQLTELIETSFARPVDTLGFEPDGRIGRGMHYHFNLNDAQYEERWRRDIPQYDIVVLAEVLEHLHTSPVFVLGFLRTLIRSHGLLIVQTPNAAALGKRLKILIGRNPYEPIRLDATNPGHFREYTERELRAYAHSSGMEVESLVFRSYFDQRFRSEKMGEPHIRRPWYFGSINIIYGLLPRRLRPGMTAALRRSD